MNRSNRLLVLTAMVLVVLGGYALVGAFGAPGSAVAEETAPTADSPPRIITVQGKATVDAKPDTAAVTLGIETQESTALQAQQANNRVMNNVVEALKKAGVREDELTTTRFSIHPVYDYNQKEPGSPPILVAYRVSNMLKVETKKLESIGSLIDVATRAGANRVQNVSFYIENTKPYERQALKAAVEDARAKAEVLASAAGTALKDVLTISENGTPGVYAPVYSRELAEAAPEMDTPIFSGEHTLTIQVTVQFSHQ